MKRLLIFLLLISLSNLKAQVGIGTTTPQGALDIESTNDGLLIPRVVLTTTTVSAPVTTPTVSELVYNTNTAGDVTPGYYYWDGTVWVRLNNAASDDWTLVGNSGTNPATNFLGTTDAQDLIFKTNDNDHIRLFNSDGSVEIGNSGSTNNSKLYVNVPNTNTSLFYALTGIVRGTTSSSYAAYLQNESNSTTNKYGLRVNTWPNNSNLTRVYGSYFQTYSPSVANTAQFTGVLNESFIQTGGISGSNNVYGTNNTLAISSGTTVTTSGLVSGFRNQVSNSNSATTSSIVGMYTSNTAVGNGTRMGTINTMDMSLAANSNTVATVGTYNRSFVRGRGTTAFTTPDGVSGAAGHYGFYNQVRLQNYSGGAPSPIYGIMNMVETNAGTDVYSMLWYEK